MVLASCREFPLRCHAGGLDAMDRKSWMTARVQCAGRGQPSANRTGLGPKFGDAAKPMRKTCERGHAERKSRKRGQP